MDHSRVPVLEALLEVRRRGDTVFGPPGHKQGRGVDPRVAEIVGLDVFRSDVLSLNGLDDRRQSQGVLGQAQELMADAVGAEQAFFSTCGSSLSVKTAMPAAAGPGDKLLLSRNAHKSVTSGVVVNGVEPIWVPPKFDRGRHIAHPPEPDDVRRRLQEHPDLRRRAGRGPGVPRVRRPPDPRRGLGRPAAVPSRAAHLGHGRRGGPGGHQRPQDGRGDRTELRFPSPVRPDLAGSAQAAGGPARHHQRLVPGVPAPGRPAPPDGRAGPRPPGRRAAPRGTDPAGGRRPAGTAAHGAGGRGGGARRTCGRVLGRRPGNGAYPPPVVLGVHGTRLLQEIDRRRHASARSETPELLLSGMPIPFTVRGWCGATDRTRRRRTP